MSDEEFARQYAAVVERGRLSEQTEPRAVSARYDRETGRLLVELRNGCLFAVPAGLLQGLQDASPSQLAAVEIMGRGTGIRWHELDVDFGIAGLLEGWFGDRAWLAQWGGSGWSAPAPPVPAEMERPEPVRQRKAS
jgi:Protein of unknown function (DUF2442)